MTVADLERFETDLTDEERLHPKIVLDPKTAANLLVHAAELLTRLEQGVRTPGAPRALSDDLRVIARWRQDFEDFHDAR